MNNSDDVIRYVLDLPLENEPGSVFVYNSGLSILLGGLIYKVSGQKADKFAEEHLFGPLQIDEYYWWRFPGGAVQTGGGLYLRPRDLAKIGYIHINDGKWGDRQVISQDWIQQVTTRQAPNRDYSFQWWLDAFQKGNKTYSSLSGHGRGGQFVFAIDELDLVVVFTGGNDNQLALQPFTIMHEFVMPAVVG
jgi:CubicO group peptidase (beta-lactamase class C family)